MPFGTFALLLLAFLAVPDVAWAWGPVAHVWYGAEAARDLTSASPALQQMLARYPWAYLYGCLAPDIIHVKSYGASIYTHCHGWHVAWRILAEAGSDEERAFGWGYLSHLAADVYAHNYFVPSHLVASFPSRFRRHVYWEARFDAQFDVGDRRRLADTLDRRDPRLDTLVERVVERTLFSFRTNQRIFEVVAGVQRFDSWQRTIRRWTDASRFTLRSEEIERYRRLCVAAIRTLLASGEAAYVVDHDPTGHRNLRQAREIRRKLRLLRRYGASTAELRRRVVTELAEASEIAASPDLSTSSTAPATPGP